MQANNILITGCAGFIGMHTARALLKRGAHVTGIDALRPYYDVSLKEARLRELHHFKHFDFFLCDITEPRIFPCCLAGQSFDYVIHLAAQPGVRHSLNAPLDYIRDNVLAHTAVLEYARGLPTLKHLLYASSSSVYGANIKQPYSETDPVIRPNSLYAATKTSAELISRSYAALYGLPQTGLRFFTVYGPWGRPDMAPSLFLSALTEDRPITLFNRGDMQRDFTYIDDIIDGILQILPVPPVADKQPDPVPCRVMNVGNHAPVALRDFLTALEAASKKTAKIILSDMQPGDVYSTYADVDMARRLCNFSPHIGIEEGVQRFVDWYISYYTVKNNK